MDTEGKQIADRLMEVVYNYDQARKRTEDSNKKIRSIYGQAAGWVEALVTTRS